MRTASLIAISTPLDEANYYSKLLSAPDPSHPGRTFFNTIEISLVCEECKKLEKMEDKLSCTHMTDYLTPSWKSTEAGARFKELYKYMEQQARALRENMGLQVSDNKPVFSSLSIDNCFSKDEISCTKSPKYIFVCVDPSGGSASISDYSVVSGYYSDEGFYVVGFFFIIIILHFSSYLQCRTALCIFWSPLPCESCHVLLDKESVHLFFSCGRVQFSPLSPHHRSLESVQEDNTYNTFE